jgi:predicted nucleotidyltransferase
MQTWHSFKTQAGNGRLQSALQALDAAITRLVARHDDTILSMVLFGSLARRRSNYDDIDVLIITEPGSTSMSDVTRRLAEEIFGPLFLEYGELFSFIVYSRQQFAQLRNTLPLLDEVRREGVLLYGPDPFTPTPGPSIPASRPPSVSNG